MALFHRLCLRQNSFLEYCYYIMFWITIKHTIATAAELLKCFGLQGAQRLWGQLFASTVAGFPYQIPVLTF